MIKDSVAFAACYWLWSGNLSKHELIAGALACGFGVGFSRLLRRSSARPLRLRRTGFVAGRALVALAAESWAAAGALARAIRQRPAGSAGTMRLEPFRQGGDGAEDAGRRALVTWGKSLGPNQFVVDIPESGDGLCVHSLRPSAPSTDWEWPV